MGDGTALVASARAGDNAAREELAKLCLGSAYRLAFQLLGRRDEARDVAQDALLRFFSHLDRIDAGRPPLPWLCAIVRNRVRDGFRRGRVRSGVESLEALPGERLMSLADKGPGPERRAAGRERQAQLWNAVLRLSSEHREIVVLRDYQDLTYAEIASVLGIPRGTVMSRLHRARRRLATELAAGRPPGADAAGDPS